MAWPSRWNGINSGILGYCYENVAYMRENADYRDEYIIGTGRWGPGSDRTWKYMEMKENMWLTDHLSVHFLGP
jgi:hypothetical protein